MEPEAERYTTEGVLGRGGMGVVHARFDHRVGRRVACKELRPDLVHDAALRARFVREARVQGQLEHPSIVPVYDIGESADGAAYFTMRTIRGITLADIVARLARGDAQLGTRFGRHALLAAFQRICLAVDYAHEQGVVHRDLKPANLILGDYGEVYVLDWGLAKVTKSIARTTSAEITSPLPPPDGDDGDDDDTLARRGTGSNALLGTPGYMAPEQAIDARSVGPATDVYALGAILFEILTLLPMHPRGLDALATTATGVEVRPSIRAPNVDTPPELERAVVAATAQAPEARCTTRALADAIERYLQGERDLELRRAESRHHAELAASAPEAAPRREVMHHISKALALDPENRAPLATMAKLLGTRIPEPLPPGLVAELDAKLARDHHMMARLGAAVYAAFALFLVAMLWMGVRQPAMIVGIFAPVAVAAGLSFVATRRPRVSYGLIVAAMCASTLGLAFATRALSPLVVIPGAIATNTMGYALFVKRETRFGITAIAVLAFAIPLALELTGATPATFSLDGELSILPTALALPRVPTLALIAGASVASILMSSVLAGYFRDRLLQAEQNVYAQAWQLRGLAGER